MLALCGPRADETPGVREDLARVSYAQNMEDILLDRLFRGRKGTFVDVGANHPTHNNNTYFFYLRGWRGVNVEPVPSARALFEAVRPGDLNLSVAISDEPGFATFHEIPDCTGLSSLSREVADEQRARGFSVVEHTIPTWTVAQVVERYRLEPPEVFSLDVEGNEGRVLRGIPLADWQPQVFVIEATRPMSNIPCHEDWEPILLGHGYLFAAFDGINRYYLRGDLAESLPLFAYPVNSLDFYERAGLVEHRDRAEELARLRGEDHARFEADRAFLDRELTHYRKEAAHHAAARVDDRGQALAELSRERDTWQVERDAWQRERDAIQVERDAIQRERDSSQRERDASQRERDAFQRERDARQAERETWHADRDARIADQGAWVAERGAWVAERGAWLLERADLIARADRAEARSEALYDQIARLRDELARAEARAAEVRQALQDAEGTLRAQRAEAIPPPHRRAGRLGFLRK